MRRVLSATVFEAMGRDTQRKFGAHICRAHAKQRCARSPRREPERVLALRVKHHRQTSQRVAGSDDLYQESPPLSLASTVGSPASNALDRVIAVAPAPLLPAEKEADYAATAGRIVGVARPRDAIKEFLIRDVIDLTWEVLRLRRAKAGILRASMDGGVYDALGGVGYAFADRSTLSDGWAAGDDRARKKVDAILAKAGLTTDEVTAKTLERKIDVFERIDRMLASAGARRNNALREIDRHRDAAGAAVRRAIDEVGDVEFRDIETGQLSGEPAS